MRWKSWWRWAIVLISILGLGNPSWAGEPTEQLKGTIDKIISILSDPALKGPENAEERNRLVRQAVDERFDWEEISRRTLGRHWSRRTKEERKEFIRLFGKLLERTYRRKVDDYSGEKVVYENEVLDGDYGVVKTKIITKKAKEIRVLYRMKKNGDSWYVYDISIEGVSLINNYRNQFNSIIVRSSYHELIKKLRAKVSAQ